MYALKFFIVAESFAAERELYADAALGPFLPRLEALSDNKDGELVDAAGHALPPCIAMEKGESLDEWSRRAKPDLFMAVTVRAVLVLHAALGLQHPGHTAKVSCWLSDASCCFRA